MFKTAMEMRLQYLYNYQRFNQSWLKQVVIDSEIYMSSPNDFNDPWDCKPWYNSDIRNPLALKSAIQFYVKSTRKHLPHISMSEVKRRARLLMHNPTFLKEAIDQVSRAMRDALNIRYRVYCLSSKPDCELMWAHYADKHAGICLKYGTDNEVFSGAIKVEYNRELPILDIAGAGEYANIQPLISKSESWKYEDEYRLVAQESACAIGVGTLLTQSNRLLIPQTALRSIVVGCLAPPQQIELIQEIIQNSGRRIGLQRVVRAESKYILEIESVS